VTSESVTN